MNFFYFLVIATLFLVTVEICKRKLNLSSSITRRISHIGASLIACFSPFFLNSHLIVIICLAFAVFMFISRRISLFTSIHKVERKTLGEVFLPLGEAFAAVIFLPQMLHSFIYGILVMGLSDAMAGFIGEKFGKHKIPFLAVNKTVEGAITFFMITVLITYFFTGFGINLIVFSLILTVIELLSGYGTDNLTLPLAAGLLLAILT